MFDRAANAELHWRQSMAICNKHHRIVLVILGILLKWGSLFTTYLQLHSFWDTADSLARLCRRHAIILLMQKMLPHLIVTQFRIDADYSLLLWLFFVTWNQLITVDFFSHWTRLQCLFYASLWDSYFWSLCLRPRQSSGEDASIKLWVRFCVWYVMILFAVCLNKKTLLPIETWKNWNTQNMRPYHLMRTWLRVTLSFLYERISFSVIEVNHAEPNCFITIFDYTKLHYLKKRLWENRCFVRKGNQNRLESSSIWFLF